VVVDAWSCTGVDASRTKGIGVRRCGDGKFLEWLE
jgi:hypothetical protein